MADQAIAIGLNAMKMGVEHGDKVWDPVQRRYRQLRGKSGKEDDDHTRDPYTMEEKGMILKRRGDVASDEEIVEVVRHKGEILPRRPRDGRARARSVNGGRDAKYAAAGGAAAAAGALVPYRDRRDDYYDSEGSVPPRSRARAKSTSAQSRRRGSSTSSSSSSSLCSSTEDEKKVRKMQRKKWITAALASVATVHAASKIYGSIEAHDKRLQQVQAGEISPEEAHKQQRRSRWQDAAAVGIAALGIRGALGEWNEVSEEHAKHKEMMTLKEEHHKKRLERERRQRARERGGYYKGRDGHWYYDGPKPQGSESYRSSESYRGSSSTPSARRYYDDRRMIKDSEREHKYIEEDDRDYDYDKVDRDRPRRGVSRSRTDDY